MKKDASLLALTLVIVLLAGCSSVNQTVQPTPSPKTGAVTEIMTTNTARTAILNESVGGEAGAYIGNIMDKQAEEIRKEIIDAKVERVGEGIKITFKSGMLFNTGKATFQESAKTELQKLAATLNKYEDTMILIEGHTDSVGTIEYNMVLSQKRAKAVASQLSDNKVNPTRFILVGYGQSQPVASNATGDGRQVNRRVELAITANEKLKKAASKNAKNNGS
jgi:outer membrane protein OmpA-like peptidoglycan-associated protein